MLGPCHRDRRATLQRRLVTDGAEPATAPLEPYCRAYDQPNLFVVDGAFLPNSAAVNPSLTIIAQAMRVSRYIRHSQV